MIKNTFLLLPEDFSFRKLTSQYTLWKQEEAKYFDKNTLIDFLEKILTRNLYL